MLALETKTGIYRVAACDVICLQWYLLVVKLLTVRLAREKNHLSLLTAPILIIESNQVFYKK